MRVNGALLINQSLEDGQWYTFTKTATVRPNGRLIVRLKPDTTAWSERVKIDFVKIETVGGATNPDLGITVTENEEPVEINSQVIYTLNVTNQDASASDVKITAQITNGSVTFSGTSLPAGWSAVNNGTTVTLTASSLPVGYNENLQIVYNTGSDTTPIHFKATITSTSQTDDNTANNTASETTNVIQVVTNADDICHQETVSSGAFCFNMGVCSGGMNCKNTIPIENIGDAPLGHVKVYYDETGMQGSFGSSCGVTPNGVCTTKSNVNFGPFGILGQTTEFTFLDPITQTSTTSAVWAKNFLSGTCFGSKKLYVIYEKNGVRYKGELKPCIATTPPPNEPKVEQCGVFPSALNAYQKINSPACSNNNDKVINASAINAASVNPTNNGKSCITCDGNKCNVKTPPSKRLTFPSFLYSDLKNQYRSVTNNTLFTKQHIKSLNIDSDNITLTFQPSTTYQNSTRKIMRIGTITQNKNNITYIFKAGDYYIEGWNINGNSVTIKAQGKVRLFVKGNLHFNTNTLKINSNGSPGDMFVFAYSDLSFPSNGGSTYDVNAYIYAKGNFLSNGNSSTSHFKGAITAEGDINLGNNQTFIYDANSMAASGLGACVVIHEGDRDFVLVNNDYSQNILGDVRTIGNTVLCVTNSSSHFGSCETGNTNATDNERFVNYINIEKEKDGRDTINVDGTSVTVYNSSAATLNITPSVTTAKPEVVWAGLFWQGSLHTWSNGGTYWNSYLFDKQMLINQDSVYLNNVTTYNQDTVYLHFPNMAPGEYTAVKVQENGFYDFYNVYRDDYGGRERDGGVYSCFADITDLFKQKGDVFNPNGEYRVANIKTMKGREANLGNYGGWSLVVIYDNRYDPNEKFRNISVYSGYRIISAVQSTQTQINVSGFRTPKIGSIDSTLSIFTGEAERYSGDYSRLVTPKGTFSLDDGLTSPSNLYQGKISLPQGSTRDRDYPNTDGIDVRNFDVSSFMAHEQSSASIKIGTQGDTYFASMVSFATELFKPNLCYDYAVKHRGHFLDVDLPDGAIPQLDLQVSPGTPLEFNIYIRNRESDIDAQVLSLHTDFDTNQTSGPTQMEYIPNSVYLSPVNGNMYINYLDSSAIVNAAADRSSVRVGFGKNPINAYEGGNLGGNDYQYIRFSTNPKTSHIKMPFKLYLDMKLKFNDNNEITLKNFRLGADIKRCEPATTYNPEWGIFTLIDYELNKNTSTPSQFYYNLRTQVVKKPFKLDLVALKESATNTNPYRRNYWEPLEANTTVEVEMADLAEFHELNATCSDSFNSIDGTQQFVQLGENEWRKTLNDQILDYANKNSTYRIWYLADTNGNLLHNPCGDKTNGSCYQQLYQVHYAATEKCKTECASPTSSCYECLRGNFAKALCSRDNFAVRPEAFDLHLKDSNGSNEIPRGTIGKTAAAYPYVLEINATTYIDNNASLGYTTNLQSGYKWSPFTAVANCDDPNDRNFTVAFFNGKVSQLINANNIGDYTISLKDESWTAVDSNASYMQHHSDAYNDYFLQGNDFFDCKRGSSIVPTDSEKLNGCIIDSEHTNANINQTYTNYKVAVLPYRFDVDTIASSVGLNDESTTQNGFVYMADVTDSNSTRMSYHLIGSIKAVGYNNNLLSNFTSSCFGDDVTLQLTNDVKESFGMQYFIISKDADSNEIALDEKNGTITQSDDTVKIVKKAFAPQNKGYAKVFLYYNFPRSVNQAINPIKVAFDDFNVTYNTQSTHALYADGSKNYVQNGAKTLNDAVVFLYAKAHAQDTTIQENSGDVNITYEVYCGGTGCDKTLLPDGNTSTFSDDPRWFINTKHTSSYGSAGTIKQKRVPRHVKVTSNPTGNHPDKVGLEYDQKRGYPYRATMKMEPNDWLIYHKYNANADHNEFHVEFDSDNSGWIGSGETDNSTGTFKRGYKDRKLSW